MDRDIFIVLLVTVFVLFYSLMPELNYSYDAIFLAFMVSQVAIVYMVYSVLKFGKDPGKKFSEGYWYADREKVAEPGE